MIHVGCVVRIILCVIAVNHLTVFLVVDSKTDRTEILYRILDLILRHFINAGNFAVVTADDIGL